MRVGHITLAMALASSTPASNIFVITVEDKIRNSVARKPNGSMRLVWIFLLGFSLLSLAHPAAAQNTWMSAGHPVPLWSNAGAWSLGMVPNGSTDISIPDGTVGGDVSFANRNTLTVGAPATLTLLSPTTVTNSTGSGFINNSGSFVNNGTLINELGGQLNNSGTLDNFGTLSNRISGFVVNTANLNNQSGGLLINDLSSTIQNDHSIANEAGATLSNSGTLNGSGFLVNFGTADNFGQLKNVVFNAGGTINNSGGSLLMGDGSAILGGTLNNAAGTLGVTGGTGPIITVTLDGSTGFGAVTIQGTYTGDVHSITNLLGTINNQGDIQSRNSGFLHLTGDATLQGGGTVTLVGGDGHLGGASSTLTNVDNTIQGLGGIFFHNAENQAGGTINANVPHQILGFSAPTMTNAGLLEATNGGELAIDNTSINNAGGKMVADGGRLQMFGTNITGGTLTALNGGILSLADGHTQGGTITALNGGLVALGASFRGEGETVTAMNGGTVQLSAGATISGGTLNNVSGTLGTLAHDTATLDGSTGFGAVTIQGTYTAGFASRTNLLG